MKKLLLFVLLANWMFATQAQNTSFKWGQVNDFKNEEEYFDEVLYFGDDATFMLKRNVKNYHYYVEKYDANLKLVYSTEAFVSNNEKTNSQSFAGAAVLNGKGYFFMHVWNDATKVNTLMGFELDDKGNEVKRFDVSKLTAEKRGKVPDYTFATSPDHSKLGIIGVYPFEKEETEKWHVIFFDPNDNKTTFENKEMDTKVPQERFEVNELLLNNDGSLFSFKVWDIKKMGQFSAFVTVNAKGEIKKTEADFDGKAATSRKVFLNKDGNATAIGFLSPDEKNWGYMAEHYYFSVNSNGDQVVSNHEGFNEALFSLVYTGDRASKVGQKISNDYKFVHFTEGEKGEVTLFLEKFNETSKSLPLPQGKTGMPPTLYSYENGQVLVIRLDNKGHMQWTSDFKKTQTYKTERQYAFWGSLVPLMSNDNVYFLWNNIDFPLIPKTGLAQPGWIDNNGTKHHLSEYGNRMVHPTCLSGFDENGNVLFGDSPVKNALPLVEMYKGATYAVSFNSKFYKQVGNKVLLIMEMPGGAGKGQSKYQMCVVTIN
jgi:hypothetical protein